MRYFVVVSILCLAVTLVSAPPPRRNEIEESKQEKHEKDEFEDLNLEYNRYLKEVVDLLESDPEFKKKLKDTQEADIRSGKIAQELEFVDHKVRTKLDEVKRQELERLRHLAQKQYELSNGIDTEHIKISSEHLDHENPHTFEMEDLKKLIAKVSADLVEADNKRRQEFKEYEMQKEFEKQERLKHLEGPEKEAFIKQLNENETKHKQHEPLHHPGSKQQLEEVWEKQDHMENQQFDPKVFFQLHDIDGNGVWDQNEVKTLFLKELDKMYEHGAPEDDMREREEEMERMREHVFSEADKNKDGLISYDEFLDKTKQPDFEKDPGWESIDQKPVYTYEEYKEFERRRQEEVQRLIQQGLIPPQPVYPPQYGYHHPPPPAYGHPQQAYHQPQYQGHHPQMGQGHPNQGYNQNQYQGGYQGGHHNQGSMEGQHQQPDYQQQHYPNTHQQQQKQQYQHQQNFQDHHQQQNQQYQPHQGSQDHHQQQNQQYQPPQGSQDHQQQNQQYQYHPGSQDHQQQNQQYQPHQGSQDHHQQNQQYQPHQGSQDHHQQQNQQYQHHPEPRDHHQQQNQQYHQQESQVHQQLNQQYQHDPQTSHQNNPADSSNNQHQQPSPGDTKPLNHEPYNSNFNAQKTGSFQKAHADIDRKDGKDTASHSMNRL